MEPTYYPSGHPAIHHGKTGILLVNLGTPQSPTPSGIRAFLKEFLSDKRVIEVNPLIWSFILNVIILNIRPFKIAASYRAIWREEDDESPLLYYTKQQAQQLQQAIEDENIVIEWAMRYTHPRIGIGIDKLLEAGCRRLHIIPLYPQYSATTTGSVYDAVFDHLRTLRWQPEIHLLDSYHDHPLYIQALAQSVRDTLSGLDWQPDAILASFHGIPKRYFMAGDPYHCFCQKTARLLKQALGLPDEQLLVSFQSRVGREEWLKPYTDTLLSELPGKNIRNLAVIAPAFASDCLETLEEIQIQGREEFLAAGGKNFCYIPCLNDRIDHITLLKDLAVGS